MAVLKPDKLEQLAIKLIEYLQKHNMFEDVSIYLLNKRYSSTKHTNDDVAITKHGEYYITPDIDVTTIVEYNNPDTITMTFEGPLYHAINYGNGKTENDLSKIFHQYGLYHEQGYAWSLAAYEE